MDYENLIKRRADLIMVTVLGSRDGGPAVDYTVNPSAGFPNVTGPEGSTEPVAHALPAWDCITGQMTALGVVTAERHRRLTGQGQWVDIALKDVAMAMLGNLGNIGEVQVNDVDRQKYGNYLYGAFGRDFLTADGSRVMVVALTPRQWTGLRKATGLATEIDALASRLGVDLLEEGNRFRARAEIAAILEPWFRARRISEFADSFDREGVTWSAFRSFRDVLAHDPDCSTANPMFSTIEQPGIGTYLVPGTPFSFGAFDREPPQRAPLLGEHTDEILAEVLGLGDAQIADLHDSKVVGGPRRKG
jgi:2-methylfumaryl-CoA isomerase